tara:strand:+ start:750 stop:1151 length:402 start_codon:yes stop_codon:yes gene_type:complete
MSKKTKRKTLVTTLDTVFSKYIRLKNSDANGYCNCITCGKKAYWEKDGIHAGHFMSRKHYSTRWDERNVKPQCHYCNTHKYGEQYKYSLYLGKETSEDLLELSHRTVKFSDVDLREMILLYKNLVSSLEKPYI